MSITADLAAKLSEKGVLVHSEEDGSITFIGMGNKRKVTVSINPAQSGDEYFNGLLEQVEAGFLAGGDEE